MKTEQINMNLSGYQLKEDVYSNITDGLLLMKKGAILSKKNIELLMKHQINPFDVIVMNTEEEKEVNIPVEKQYTSLIDEVRETFQQLVQEEDSDVDILLQNYKRVIDSSINEISIMDIIHQKIDQEDYLYQHSINVGILSAIIGKILGLTNKQCHLLSQMGLFHDIGMLKIDPEILQKDSRLTHHEYKEIQKHTSYGKSILFRLSQLDLLVSRTALLHHEKINGKGYPSNRTEKDIPFLIQIISVADTFNSMCTSYTYKKKKTYYEAIYELVGEAYSNSLNPAIVIPFTNYIMRKQLFQKVQLNNSQTAEIIFIHQNEPHLPLIRVDDSYIDLRKEPSLKIIALAN
ncbi:HD-GYP domain-containing protein [Bacillus sp. B1-b2]|uniref:HD-GYP domain-containing protein n=1 Tax=Bacillus sp. B1-b2 TaxID=2653201 RepID=UPI0012620B05|nr:HD domain-containing phosphohydrolase [Bacillus sp. B1-b2]KAB7665781.1 HD domain-containing protein [Bacillus sp. B1-b2]